jgi:sulfate adenylyltransferase subunit 1 (EFTu-like GTPase family)
MSTITQHGYFVIAGISGYTSFVAKTELEHSHEILTELLELLLDNFKPLMTISKLEGDAVFAYAAESAFARGETLLEFMESIYVAFRGMPEYPNP